MDICSIDDEAWSVHSRIGGEVKKIEEVFFEIVIFGQSRSAR